MTISEALLAFQELAKNTSKRSERSLANKFIDMFENLKTRSFTEEQLNSIETEIASLNLKSDLQSKKKKLQAKYDQFTNYMAKNHELYPDGYFTQKDMTLWMTMGAGLGIIFGLTIIDPELGSSFGISIGAGAGVAIGIGVGSQKDKTARKANKVMSNKAPKKVF